MFCGQCRSKLREEDVFCTECGKQEMEVNQSPPMDGSINQGTQPQEAQQSIDVTGKSAMFIAYKLKEHRFICFFVVLAVWVIFLIVFIVLLVADGNAGIVVISLAGAGTLFCIFPWGLIKQINFLKETNSYDCINDVLNGKVLPDLDTGLAFANSYLYDEKSGFIVKYDSITNVYVKRTRHTTNGVRTGADEMMIVNLINGNQIGIHMRNLSRKEEKDLSLTPLATLIMAEIISRNPNVKLGYEGDK